MKLQRMHLLIGIAAIAVSTAADARTRCDGLPDGAKICTVSRASNRAVAPSQAGFAMFYCSPEPSTRCVPMQSQLAQGRSILDSVTSVATAGVGAALLRPAQENTSIEVEGSSATGGTARATGGEAHATSEAEGGDSETRVGVDVNNDTEVVSIADANARARVGDIQNDAVAIAEHIEDSFNPRIRNDTTIIDLSGSEPPIDPSPPVDPPSPPPDPDGKG